MKIWKIAQNNIAIDISKYIESAKIKIESYIDFDLENYHRLLEYKFNPEWVINSLQAIGYPNIQSVNRFIQTRDLNLIHDVLMEIFEWWKQNKRDCHLWEKVSPIVKALNDYESILEGNKITWTEDFGKQKLQELIRQTQSNMEKIQKDISEAISKIPYWHNSFIVIKADELYKDNSLLPQESANIEVGKDEGGAGKASFSYFVIDNGIEIDDVLESGDTDFFIDSNIQSDYFNLVNILKNPMAFNKPKILTLYTARPTKDRNFYMNKKEVPINIFLTNRYDFAEGFAMEYGGKKDIWKVKISDRYLVKTMDSPDQKQYQVIGDKTVPVISMELITTWESMGAESNE